MLRLNKILKIFTLRLKCTTELPTPLSYPRSCVEPGSTKFHKVYTQDTKRKG